jgi:hypothetical protein
MRQSFLSSRWKTNLQSLMRLRRSTSVLRTMGDWRAIVLSTVVLPMLLLTCASCGSQEPEAASSSGQFSGSWLCNLTLVQEPGGITTYPPAAVKTVVHGSSLSVYAEESDSEPQSWFCGYNYTIHGLEASLQGSPTCHSNDTVDLESATISVTADGKKLSLTESGTETGYGSTEQSNISGSCSRN